MGATGDHSFIAMENIDGDPLSVRIKSGVSPEFAVDTAKRIAIALGFAHSRGVLHRDIKPSNILLRENRFAVLTDFGIAKASESDSELTLAGSVLGTPSYMSPQQASGQKIDHRSDLYSLGVVLFEMLASRRPFMGDTPVATALKHATDPIPRLPQPITHFQPIIDRILAKSPQDRFQFAEEFIKALDSMDLSEASPTDERATMVPDQDVVQSLGNNSPHPSRKSSKKWVKDGPMHWVSSKLEKFRSLKRSNYLKRDHGKNKEPKSISAEPENDNNSDIIMSTGYSNPQSQVATPRPSSDSIPKEISKYHIIELIGPGKMRPLYRAFDRVNERLVALKVISNDSRISETERARFFSAGKDWIKLKHPNIINIHDLDFSSEARFIAMEFLEGKELQDLIHLRQNLSLEEKLSLMVQICNGLHYVHQQGILHRDIRPKSIFVSPTQHAKILDFGIARKATSENRDLTMVGEVLGDRKYIAPEQALGNPDFRSDVFSVGAVFCDLLTYQIPSGLESKERFASLKSLQPSVPEQLVTIIEKALSDDPDRRFSDLNEMIVQFEKLQQGNVQSVIPSEKPCEEKHLTTKQAGPQTIFTLHGIRTYAAWQRAFSEVAGNEGWRCRLDKWNFVFFSPQVSTTEATKNES